MALRLLSGFHLSSSEFLSVLREGGKNYWNICWAGRRGEQSLFLRKKNEGALTLFEEKNDGVNAFFDEKNDGAKTFLSEFKKTLFLLLMISCLTLDAECFLHLDIVQFTTTYHCA
jgi:hypothetical protein